jgi:hypothetical protein
MDSPTGLRKVISSPYGDLAAVAARKLGIPQARNISGVLPVSCGVAATETGRVLCCIEGTVVWETQLPFVSQLHNAEVELQLTSSTDSISTSTNGVCAPLKYIQHQKPSGTSYK